MSKNFGDKQSFMHNTLIKESHGYLGPYPKMHNPGDVQHMVFTKNDPGPFWLSETEREEQCHDTILEGRRIQRWLKKEEQIRNWMKRELWQLGTWQQCKN
jgi:hypothetical protein